MVAPRKASSDTRRGGPGRRGAAASAGAAGEAVAGAVLMGGDATTRRRALPPCVRLAGGMSSLLDAFARSLPDAPATPALELGGASEAALSFGELARGAGGMAGALARRGLRP